MNKSNFKVMKSIKKIDNQLENVYKNLSEANLNNATLMNDLNMVEAEIINTQKEFEKYDNYLNDIRNEAHIIAERLEELTQ